MGDVLLVSELAWMAAGGATCFSLVLIFRTVILQRTRVRAQRNNSEVWLSAHEAAERLSSGVGTAEDSKTLDRHLSKAKTRPSAIGATIAALRSVPGEPDPSILKAVGSSGVGKYLRAEFRADDPHRRATALEIVEATRLHELTGEVADLALDSDPEVVRAATNALVILKPELAVGVLVGLLSTHGPWVVDSLGRAAHILSTRDNRNIPIARPHWRDAPKLAERALNQGLLSEPGDASDAVAVMIGLLNDDDSEKRLGAVNALANVITHPGAQIALAGAIGVDDRVTRFAAAVRMADTEEGRRVLRNAADGEQASDAAQVAALVLWGDSE